MLLRSSLMWPCAFQAAHEGLQEVLEKRASGHLMRRVAAIVEGGPMMLRSDVYIIWMMDV